MVCLRVCAYILKNAIPSTERPASRTIPSLISLVKVLDTCRTDNQSNTADRVTLIKTSFDALLSIGSSFDVKTQDEVRAVAISLYSGMCADPSHLPYSLKMIQTC
jgi:hypothetical protein